MAGSKGHNPSTIRTHNRGKVLDIIRKQERASASEIARSLGLSRTTIWKIIEGLQNDGLILSMGKDRKQEDRGKKAELYSLNRNYGYVISITIFSNYLLYALLNTKGIVFYKEKQTITRNAHLKEVIPSIAEFIERWQIPDGDTVDKNSLLLGIVLGSTGVTDTENGICFTAAKFTSWPRNAPIKKLIEERVILKAPLHIDNYNRYSAFAEKHLGGLNEFRNIVNILTGPDELGGGILINGRLHRGSHYLSGEIGHMKLNPFWDKNCHCGGKGCFEQMVSVNRILTIARNSKNEHPDSALNSTEKDIEMKDIFRAADEGDNWGRNLLNEAIQWFAIGIQNIVLLFDPEIIVISGIYNQGSLYFLKKLTEEVNKTSLTGMKKNIEVRYSILGKDAPLLGGAHYVIEEYFSNRKKPSP